MLSCAVPTPNHYELVKNKSCYIVGISECTDTNF